MKEQEVKEHWIAAKFIRPNGTILDFTGLYEVSSLGRVRSLNYRCTRKIRVLKLSMLENTDGTIFYQVGLRKGNRQYKLLVHRLILSSFNMEGWFKNAVVNHKSERTSASCINKLSNLEWTTQAKNCQTEHSRKAKSKTLTARKDQSKVVKVTFADGTTEIYPSKGEAERILSLPHIISSCIRNRKGYYKKLGLHFGYID